MFLSALTLILPTASASYTGTTLLVGGLGHQISTAVMSPNGNVCFSTYGRTENSTYYWERGDSAPTTVATAATPVYCAAVTNSAYAALYGYSSSSTIVGYRYDGLTDELTELESTGSYSYPYLLNENGYAAGYASDSSGVSIPVWWAPGDSEVNTINDYATDYAYPSGLTESNELLLTLYELSGSLYEYEFSLYGLNTDVSTNLSDVYSGASTVQLMEDDTVLEFAYGGAIDATIHDPAYGTTVELEFPSSVYAYPIANNASGEVIFYLYQSDGTYSAGCWSPAYGFVELETAGDSSFPYAINDIGMVVGYQMTSGGRFARVEPMVWDCSTGVAEPLSVDLGSYVYAMNVTEFGDVLLYTSSRDGTSYYLYDYADGTVERIGGGRGYASLYGFSQETGDALMLEYGRTGRSSRLRYYTYTR